MPIKKDVRSRRNVFEEIEDWKLEAKLEDTERYFYHTREISKIETGKYCYVIGRKGSGKTAISEYLHRKIDEKKFSKKLSFKNFPFADLYQFSNDSYTPPNQYITFWKYVIYSSIAQLMSKNENIDGDLRGKLSKIYPDDPLKSLPRTINQWTGGNFDLQVLGTGLKVSPTKTCSENITPWIQRVEVLEDIIGEYLDDSSYYIIFDELDEDYKDIIVVERYKKYTELLTSLFKAVQDIKSIFPSKRFCIYPVIFLRNDIYDIISDPDKTKWRDLMVEIEWTNDSIQPLLAFRISRAHDPSGEIMSFHDAWNIIFSKDPVGYGNRQQKRTSMFNYITRSTHIRPRDYIRYFQACSSEVLSECKDRISPQMVVKADKAFSNFFRSELEDEIHGILPEIGEILNIISQLKKQTFRYEEFKEQYVKKIRHGVVESRDPEFVLKILFNFSVIGNQPSQLNVQVFRYLDNDARFITKEAICVHRGLFKALQIL